jgi:hypothetical protein
MRFSLLAESLDAPKCFAELNALDLFAEYRIESQSANTILFEVSLTQVSKALLSGKVASQSLLKLVKRDGRPCLCFETKADESILSVDVYHDIPIKLMRSTEVMHSLPPQMPPPSVALDIPRGKLLKTIVDKLTKFSKHVQITASQSGKLNFRADHPSVTINTYYTGLFARYVGDLTMGRDVNNQVVCKLNLRKLSMVLNMHNVPVDHATLCKCPECCMHAVFRCCCALLLFPEGGSRPFRSECHQTSYFIQDSDCNFSDLFFSSHFSRRTVFTPNDGVMLLVHLEPARLGTLSYYLPILLVDQEDEDVQAAGGAEEAGAV